MRNIIKRYALLLTFLLSGIAGCKIVAPDKIIRETALKPKKHIIAKAEDRVLFGYHFSPLNKSNGKLVYYLHGNAGNYSTHYSQYAWLLKRGVEVFALDYRGFGESTGKPELAGMVADVQQGYRFIKENFDDKQLIVYAQSMGTMLNLNAMSQATDLPDICAVVLEGGFFDINTMAEDKAPLIGPLLLGIKKDTLLPDFDKINQYELPFYIIHSREDEVVPESHGKALSTKLKDAKYYQQIGAHLQYLSDVDNQDEIFEIITDHTMADTAQAPAKPAASTDNAEPADNKAEPQSKIPKEEQTPVINQAPEVPENSTKAEDKKDDKK